MLCSLARYSNEQIRKRTDQTRPLVCQREPLIISADRCASCRHDLQQEEYLRDRLTTGVACDISQVVGTSLTAGEKQKSGEKSARKFRFPREL